MLEDVVQLWIVPSAGLKQSILLFTDMREASRRLSQSLFDVYESDWAGEEDLGAIVEVSAPKKKTIAAHFNFTSAKTAKMHASPGAQNPLISPLLVMHN